MNWKTAALLLVLPLSIACAANGPAQWRADWKTVVKSGSRNHRIKVEDNLLRIYSEGRAGNVVTQPLPAADFAGKTVLLECFSKQKDVEKIDPEWLCVRIQLAYSGKNGKMHYPQARSSAGTHDWERKAFRVELPKDLTRLELHLGLRTKGELFLRDLSVREVSPFDLTGCKFRVSTDHPDAQYQPGKPIVFAFELRDRQGKLRSDVPVRLLLSSDDGKKQEIRRAPGEALRLQSSIVKPGFVRATAQAVDEGGNLLLDERRRPVELHASAGTEFHRISPGVAEPEDFDRFWTKQKQFLASVPLNVLKKELVSKKNGCSIYAVEIACAGRANVCGYLSIPENARPGTLEAKVIFDGYGVRDFAARPEKRVLTFAVNAHGVPTGKTPEFYRALEKGKLRRYGFDPKENSNPETCYFRDMILRAIRALDYVRTLPEWDGKHLSVSGGSQGGFQALSAAGLVPETTYCGAYVPWFCDVGGRSAGRVGGWLPDYTPALRYFDPVFHAKRIRAETRIVAGLGDPICPPSGILALYNNLPGTASLTLVQGGGHGSEPPNAHRFTLSKSKSAKRN